MKTRSRNSEQRKHEQRNEKTIMRPTYFETTDKEKGSLQEALVANLELRPIYRSFGNRCTQSSLDVELNKPERHGEHEVSPSQIPESGASKPNEEDRSGCADSGGGGQDETAIRNVKIEPDVPCIKTEIQHQNNGNAESESIARDCDINRLGCSSNESNSKIGEDSCTSETARLQNSSNHEGDSMDGRTLMSEIEARLREEAILRDIFSDGRRNRKSSNTICEVCGYKAGRVNHLKTHMRKHTGEKPYSCGICDFRTGALLSLQRHMRVHTGEKPYSCGVCEYRSAHLSDMKRHVTIHSGEKPHACLECPYRCASLKEMRRHMRTHTGEKPYSCELCYYKASQKATLTAHMKVHTGEKPFSCSFCDYRARRASHVTRHMKTHSGELTRVLALTTEDPGAGDITRVHRWSSDPTTPETVFETDAPWNGTFLAKSYSTARRSSTSTNSMHLSNVVVLLVLADVIPIRGVKPGDFPFLATILYNHRGICGGVLYTTTRLVAACHCLVANNSGTFQAPHIVRDASRILVDMGNDADRPSGVFRSAKFVDVHPKCKCTSRAMLYDYALIEVDQPFVVTKGEIEVSAIFDHRNDIANFYNDPGAYYCTLLDFKIIPRKHHYDLGSLLSFTIHVESIAWCVDKYRTYLKSLDFDGSVQLCSNSEEKVCQRPDVGGPVVCSLSEDFQDKLTVGLLTGRHHPYCGKETHLEFVVSEVYARIDGAMEWLEGWKPTPPRPHSTVSTESDDSDYDTEEPEPTNGTQTGRTGGTGTGGTGTGGNGTDTVTMTDDPISKIHSGEPSCHSVHPLLYPTIPLLLACIST
ncbi:hypothetical protein GE061_008661 [Apolygus lucorum]|uniref:Peptidase S1 domain-containing protein n=1 Tax=Apolygus lucorum TaxID=248454 RepID=A0A8S9WQK7_APOLU|nr:hypothetical protein GE061_008661 [Apolygus lucorum]